MWRAPEHGMMDALADSSMCEEPHTEMPEGYLAWHAAAEWMRKLGLKQRQCPGCGRYKVWVDGDRIVESFYWEYKRRKTA